MRWEKLQMQARMGDGGREMGPMCGPGKRWGHTCNAIKGGKLLYVFGGYGKDNSQTNQVHVFDTATRTWSEPVLKGTLPLPRDSHSCTTVGDNLFVFGGTDGRNTLKDLHILDTSSNTWISPSVSGEGPDAREGHSAALIDRHLFIFGGCGKSSTGSNEEFYDDLYILNTETFEWQHASTSGSSPAKRDSHTCSSWKNKIIIIGGEDSDDYYLSDVYILDADTLVWSKLDTSGQLLPPRGGHTTVALGKNLFVFGGFTDESSLYDDIYMLDVGKANIYIREYQPFRGKRTFQAKVTKCFPVGYTIETTIDGKLLHGVLFSNKFSFKHADDISRMRKGTVEINNVKLNIDQKSNSGTTKPIRQDKIDDWQADCVNGKNAEAAAATPNVKSSEPSDASQPHEQVSVKSEVSVEADANVKGNETKSPPIASSEMHKDTAPEAKDCHFLP